MTLCGPASKTLLSLFMLFTCVSYAEARNRYSLDVRLSVCPSVLIHFNRQTYACSSKHLSIFRKHWQLYQSFAMHSFVRSMSVTCNTCRDDTQFSLRGADVDKLHAHSPPLADINGLSLNPNKTEAMAIDTGVRQRAEGPVTAVDIGAVTVQTSHNVKYRRHAVF